MAEHFPLALSPLSGNSVFIKMLHRMRVLGGGTKIPWRWYTPWQKMAALALITGYMEEDGVCWAEAARRANIAQQNVAKWAKRTTIFNELERNARLKKSCHKRPESQLVSIQDKLLLYIFKMCETGTAVDYVLVLFKAASLLQSFCTKPHNVQYCAVACFMKRHPYTYRMGTHKSQHLLEEIANKAGAWMDHICLLVLGPHCNLRYVININHTPVFLMIAKKTLKLIGCRTILVTSNTKRATVAITITRSDHTLTPLVVFKGTENGRIKKK